METPKYKVGDIVLVKDNDNEERILQGTIHGAECYPKGGVWFYHIKVADPMKPTDGLIDMYTYEIDSGDAKTSIVKLITNT